MPSGNELKKKGLNIGDMQKLQMQKIEELTLYIIKLEHRINELENKK